MQALYSLEIVTFDKGLYKTSLKMGVWLFRRHDHEWHGCLRLNV